MALIQYAFVSEVLGLPASLHVILLQVDRKQAVAAAAARPPAAAQNRTGGAT